MREVATSNEVERANAAYVLQARIMSEIFHAEELLDLKKTEGLDRHIHRLRLCVDAICFLLLHPHTIRQLQKNTGAPPRLTSQRGACESALRVVREHAERGITCLIADLSNVLRISDVVVCDDIEVPTLVECKANVPSPSLLLKGRKGRQTSRALGTLNYLQHGAAKIIGEEVPRLALDSKVNRKKCQDTIERVLEFGSRLGQWYEFVSPFDLVICVRPQPEASGVDMEPYMSLFADFRQPLVGSYAVSLWNPQLLIPPAIIWDLDFDHACGLMEEELLLIHVIDLAGRCKTSGLGYSLCIN
ncbi:MAG: hypothetical protein IT419_17515 [Planctomycetes bacterium]|nr:hypothetical protein [Planctomycetota bacterium]